MRHLAGSWGAAFIAGLVYGYWTYRLSDYNHPNTISTQWLPLTLLCTILLVKKQKLSYAIAGGLFLALTGISRWQMLLPTAIAMSAYLLFSLLFERQHWSWRVVGMLAVMGLVTTLLIAWPISPLIPDLVTGGLEDYEYRGQEWTTASPMDLLAYFVPPGNHPLASLFTGLGYAHQVSRFGYEPSSFLGYTVLALVISAVVWQRKAARLWIVLALVAFLLAPGPVLLVNGVRYQAVPMPYRLVGWTAPMRWMRTPHRFNVLLALPVAVLAGYGASALRDRFARRKQPWPWVLFSLLILFDYANVPAAMVEARVPDFYQTIAETPDDFAIVGLPGDRRSTEYYMFYQTVHGRPLLTGHISRLPANALAFVSSVPMLDGIYESGTIDTNLPDLSRQLSLLADAGFRYIILHKNLASSNQLSKWRSYLTVSPRYEDDQVVVYPTRPVIGQDYALHHKLGERIGLIAIALSQEEISPDAHLEIDVAWGNTLAPETNFQVELSLIDERGNVGQRERFTVSPDWPPAEWPANAIARDRYTFQIDPFLTGGKHEIVAQLVVDDEPAGESVTVGEVTMLAPRRSFDAPPMEHHVQVDFGRALQLLGYDQRVEEGTIRVTLHWRALERMDVAYKFFVHLYDAESGELFAQADVMPHNWTYPTTWWEKGEIVSDEITLSVPELVTGRYRLAVGVYHPDTNERLAIVEPTTGQTSGDDHLILPEVIEYDVDLDVSTPPLGNP
jgi:hypothetical protein